VHRELQQTKRELYSSVIHFSLSRLHQLLRLIRSKLWWLVQCNSTLIQERMDWVLRTVSNQLYILLNKKFNRISQTCNRIVKKISRSLKKVFRRSNRQLCSNLYKILLNSLISNQHFWKSCYCLWAAYNLIQAQCKLC